MDLPNYYNFYFLIFLLIDPTQIRSYHFCFSSLPPYVSVVKAIIHEISGSRVGFTVVLE